MIVREIARQSTNMCKPMKMQGRESEQNPSREDFISYEKKKPWAFLNGIVYYCGKDQ